MFRKPGPAELHYTNMDKCMQKFKKMFTGKIRCNANTSFLPT